MSKDRFKDALWYNKPARILVFGAGGIGSWTSFFLTRAGFNVLSVDYDLVEEHNLGGQMFLHQDIGESKVIALHNTIALFNDNDYSFTYRNEKLVQSTNLDILISKISGYATRTAPIIIISAFDNMEARKLLFEKFLAYCNSEYSSVTPNKVWFVDGRLLMEQMRIYCIPGDNQQLQMDYIDNHLFADSDVEDLMCTMKQVSHGAAMIATHITGFVTNIISNVTEWDDNVFKIPYIWDYIIPFNKLTENYEAR